MSTLTIVSNTPSTEQKETKTKTENGWLHLGRERRAGQKQWWLKHRR